TSAVLPQGESWQKLAPTFFGTPARLGLRGQGDCRLRSREARTKIARTLNHCSLAGPAMSLPGDSQVSAVLQAAQAGDRQAAAELLPLVYAELRQLARARLARAVPGQTLTPT